MSIATELQRILDTKKDLRNALNIDDSVPFSQYAAHIPWRGEPPPASTRFFDFVGNRYSADGFPALLSSLGITFTRLSSATQWKDGVLVDVAANVMRLDKTTGLLIEPQRTNLFPDSVMNTLDGGAIPTTLEIGEGNIVPAVMLPHGVRSTTHVIIMRPSPYVISMYVKNSDNSEPTVTGPEQDVGRDFLFFASAKTHQNSYVVSKISSVYRVSTTSTLPESAGGTGIIKHATNSPKDVTATWPQLEAGDTLTSYIRSSGSPTTRAKETLVVPFTAGQTVTAEKDESVTMTIVDNNAVFEGQGYIRSIRVN